MVNCLGNRPLWAWVLIPILAPFVATAWEGGESKVSAPSPAVATVPLYPLALGNSWTYTTTIRDEDGTIGDTIEERNYVKGVVDFEDGRFYHVVEFDVAVWTRNTAEGMEEVGCVIDEETDELVIESRYPNYYKYPVAKGTTYELFSEVEEETAEQITVTEVDVEVATPAGKFRCLCYELTEVESKSLVQRTWMSPGVGIVKFEVYDEGKPHVTSILKSFALDPEAKPPAREVRPAPPDVTGRPSPLPK